MLRIRFTKHADFKIEVLKHHGFYVDYAFIEETVIAPDKVEAGYGQRKVAQKAYDEAHVLRVVYEEKGSEMLVVTVYPGRRSRYEKN